jgi:threonine/homoserine/homoserine lactone efflux protein
MAPMSFSALFSAHVLLAYIAYFIGTASPGPSNLAIMSLAMRSGRKAALTFALGVVSGSFCWALLASLAVPGPGAFAHAAVVPAGCLCIGVFVFATYAVLFSTVSARRIYAAIRRWMEGTLALVFCCAGIELIASRS